MNSRRLIQSPITAEVMPRLPALSGGRIRLSNKPAWAMTAVGHERRSSPSGRLSGLPLTADEPTVIALLSSGPATDLCFDLR